MCSFSHDAAQGSDGREGLLAHGDFETLLHELGHVVHNLLSRTEFQYLSGTCCNMQHATYNLQHRPGPAGHVPRPKAFSLFAHATIIDVTIGVSGSLSALADPHWR
jgi:hypothetical protein